MSVEIVLDSNEDGNIIKNLVKYCNEKKLTMNTDSIIIRSIDTGLVKVIVEGNNIKNIMDIPGYDLYAPFTLSVKDANVNQTVVLAVLKLFYSLEATYSTSNNKISYYFSDGYTPFYLKVSKFVTYIANFTSLLGKKLVTTNPLFEVVLKVYPNNAIKRYFRYNLWYIDSRSTATIALRELELLTKEGYFYVDDDAIIEKVMYLFNFTRLGEDTKEGDRNYIYKDIPGRKPIRGPLLVNNRLTQDFFIACVSDIRMDITPIVTVSVNYPCFRRTLAGCILSYLNSGYFTLSMLDKIIVYPENDIKGWITLPAINFNVLSYVITHANTKNITIYDMDSLDEGIRYHLEILDNLLLKDDDGYFIAIEDYDGPNLNTLLLKKIISPKEMENHKSNYTGLKVKR